MTEKGNVMTKLSVLDLVRIKQGGDARSALDDTRDLAAHLERWNYGRIWISEHHNASGIASAATALVLAHIGAATSTIRLAAGGIMLPNHAPYVIAEQFGTLAQLFPGRVDLGLGRAPGTDQMAVRALRRPPQASDSFPQDVIELQAYFEPSSPGQRLVAAPADGTEVPLIILGSSLFGAALAGDLGLPYAFASHFAPDLLLDALRIYRERFKPSKQMARPYAMVGVNVVAADTDYEARRLATSQQKSFADLLQHGTSGPLEPPINNIDDYWSPRAKAQAGRLLARSVVGGLTIVKEGLEALLQETSADELILVSDVYERAARLRSFEIVASVMGLTTP
ncbi:LLM class flavin-dependent oxidoreductase [Microcoleus sp. Pol7_B2]|uniref:LLM class flavin-dependent oxidoreductase n=1 Tax=Microcoleus sp. Pol7_B2 TaxID=2818895 RepID=UPI002FD19A13